MIVHLLIISFQEHLECLGHTAKTTKNPVHTRLCRLPNCTFSTKETVIFIKCMYIFLQVHL